MDKTGCRAASARFLREHPEAVTAAGLQDAVEAMGYMVIFFRPGDNSPAVETVIETLALTGMTASSKAFTYADGSYRLVFCHADLSEDERRMVLAHEAGHIFLNHLSHAPVLGRDVTEEYEANEFAHYLLRRSGGVREWFRGHRRLAVAAAALLLVAAAGVLLWKHLPRQTQEVRQLPDAVAYYGDYYVTATGNKFHRAECSFITGGKHAEGVRRLTVDDYESGRYSPCSRCLSDFVPETE